MSKLVWDTTGEHFYETGTDHGVVYPTNSNGEYGTGVVWNGLTAVTESPSGAEPTDIYADNMKYLSIRSAETFGGTIEALYSPKEFDECDGTAEVATGTRIGQQSRKMFGFCYRTLMGNDVDATDHGYKLHLIYGATASPSERSYSTVNDSPETMTLSWEIDTTPVNVTGYKPTSTLTIDSTEADATKLAALEDILYSTEQTQPRLPLPDEVITLMS